MTPIPVEGDQGIGALNEVCLFPPLPWELESVLQGPHSIWQAVSGCQAPEKERLDQPMHAGGIRGIKTWTIGSPR